MPPLLALGLVTALIVILFYMDRQILPIRRAALWLPLVYFFILASRNPSQWIWPTPGGAGAFEDGNLLDRLVYLALLICSLAVLGRRRGAIGRLIRENWLLAAFVTYGLISVSWSDFPLIAFKRWIRDLGMYTTIGVVATDPDVDQAVRLVFRRLSYLGLLLSVLLIKYFPSLGRSFSSWTGEGYNAGVATSKNGLGALSLVCGLYLLWDCFTIYRSSARMAKVFAVDAALIAAAVWLLVQSSSATSLMCFIIGGALLASMYLFRRVVAPRTLVRITVLALVAYVWADYVWNLTEVLVRSAGRDMTFTGRVDIWQAVLDTAKAPVVGAGYESFWIGKRLEELWLRIPGVNQAHNGFLEVYANLGAIGVVLAVGLLVFYYRRVVTSLVSDLEFTRLATCAVILWPIYNMTEAAIKAHVIWYAVLALGMTAALTQRERATGERVAPVAGKSAGAFGDGVRRPRETVGGFRPSPARVLAPGSPSLNRVR